MNPPLSPLDRPASIPVLRRLAAAGALTREEARTLESRVRRDLPWRRWLDRGLLALGVGLVLAGIGYFFAHNWDHLTDTDKLVLAGGAVLLSLIGTTWAGLDRFAGKLLLLAASLLVGVYLAVFGQVYQTGADTYELFTGWAFLIFPWVVLGRFMPLALAWLALLNLAFGFYCPVASPFEPLEDWTLFRYETIGLALLNLTALLLREGAGRWRPAWMDRGWSALIVLTAMLAPATISVCGEILHTWDHLPSVGAAFLAVAVQTALVVGLGFYYSRVRYSLAALAVTTLSACSVLTILAFRLLDFDQPHLDPGLWLIMGVVVLGIFGGGVFFLRTMRRAHSNS